jgi:hypothetical protein
MQGDGHLFAKHHMHTYTVGHLPQSAAIVTCTPLALEKKMKMKSFGLPTSLIARAWHCCQSGIASLHVGTRVNSAATATGSDSRGDHAQRGIDV